MNAKEKRIVRTAAAILRSAQSMRPQNPADIKMITVSNRAMGEVCRIIASALDAMTDDSCGGVDGAEWDIESAEEAIEAAKREV